MSDSQDQASAPAAEKLPGVGLGIEVTALSNRCLLAGLFGGMEVDDLLDELRRERDQQLTGAESTHQAEITEIDQSRSEWEEHRRVLSIRLDEVRGKLATHQDQLIETDRRSVAHRRARISLIRSLIRRRSTYPLRIIHHRVEAQVELTREMAAALQETEQALFDLDRQHHEVEQARRQLNEKEYQRRSQELHRRKDRVEEQLSILDHTIERLHRVGITRKTYGFLLWAGYLSFPAFGWLAGEAIRSAVREDESLLRELLTLLAHAVSTTTGAVGVVWTLIGVALLPLVLLGFWTLTILSYDNLLMRFDRNWKHRGRSGRNTSAAVKSPQATIHRSDYTQLLAKFPIVYAWWMVPMGLATLVALAGQDADITDLSVLWARPGESIFYTFLGGVLAVVVAGFVMLYCNRIVEPRLQEPDPSSRRSLVANIEIVTLGGCSVLAVIVQAWMRTTGIEQLWLIDSAPGVLLLLLLAGFIVAYGLMYKGIFQTRRALEHEVQLLDEAIGRYEGAPAVALDDDEADRHRTILRNLYLEVEERWRRVEYVDPPRLSVQRLFSIFNSPDDLTVIPYGMMDALIEPELVERIDTETIDASIASGEAQVLRGELERLEQEITTLQSEHRSANQELVLIKQRAAEAGHRHARKVFELSRAYRDAIVRCETAFQIGRQLQDSKLPDLKIIRA